MATQKKPSFIPVFFSFSSPCHISPPPPSEMLRSDVDEVEDTWSLPEREQMSHASHIQVCVCVFHTVTGSMSWLIGSVKPHSLKEIEWGTIVE